jgi:diguanylate cyclase
MNSEEQSKDEINGFARLALGQMARHDIAPSPENYTVWFMHVSGRNAELSRTIEDLISRGEPFTDHQSELLFKTFCAEKSHDDLMQLKDDLQQIIITLLSEISRHSGQTSAYSQLIEESVSRLEEDTSLETLSQSLHVILEESKAISNYSHQLQDQLDSSTQELEVLQKELEEAKAESMMDFLTRVPNRKAFYEKLVAEAGDVPFDAPDLSLLVIDIDHFKKFNDEYGHIVGDQVLRFVAKKIGEIIRGRDFLARFGGEEFVVLLPKTPLAGALTVAENIRSYFDNTDLKSSTSSKKLGKVTLSLGVTVYQPGEPVQQFIDRADKALYSAKKGGRNQVISSPA